jgi:GNAT superfamily N-acetyltransferase
MQEVKIRLITKEYIPKIVSLQRQSFSDMASYGMIWPPEFLENHIRVFPDGQLCAVVGEGRIIASASSLITSLRPPYRKHNWYEITEYGMFNNHDPKADSLYGADISTHPEFQHRGIGSMLYSARKEIVKKLNLKRMIIGGRLYNYSLYADQMTAEQYARKVVDGELVDPVLTFQLKNGFRFIKILPDYLYDRRSLNYASFLEWLNPNYQQKDSYL